MISEEKYLKKVILAGDVYAACLQHALTTEKEEVMGLLIGEVDEKKCISQISACVILHRSDKQPDRVEISPEQLCTASGYAEELANKLRNHVQLTCFQAYQSGSEYQRREIEIVIENVNLRSYNLESIASLPRILSQEEVQSHEGEGDNCVEDELAMLHNDAFKTVALVHIVSKLGKPLCEDLEARLQTVNLRITELEKMKKKLLTEH
ncbi:JAB domain containing protein [Asbolus verrucosus]|uniref:JAB domain containing protein n=1 Tax=Asbolus verrucosus TaxID=1661398 RepID=A0A482VDS4_ASBVE|nr:JAB domain containing protein [Asbolus verrucosus]